MSNNSKSIQILNFTFDLDEVRVLADNEGLLWFVAQDICQILGIVDHLQAVERLDDEERGRYSIPTPGGAQKMLCISEPGFYRLVMTSRKRKAKELKKWVFSTLLPEVRKLGWANIPELPTNARVARYLRDGKSWGWIGERLESIDLRKGFTGHLRECGVSSWQYARLTNEVYRLLFDMDARQLKQAMGLTPKDSIRDNLSIDAITATRVTEYLGATGIRNSDVKSNKVAAEVVRQGARLTRDALETAKRQLFLG